MEMFRKGPEPKLPHPDQPQQGVLEFQKVYCALFVVLPKTPDMNLDCMLLFALGVRLEAGG